MGQAADGRVAEAKHDRKERVEILLLLEAVSTRPRHPQRKQPCPQRCLGRVGGLGSKGSWGPGNKEKADWATQWAGKGVKKGRPQGWQHRATVSTHIPLSLSTPSSLHTAHCPNRHSLGRQLDELPEQLSPGPRNRAETELGGHPILQLIEAPHEALQVCGGDIPQVLGPQHVMDQLHLDGAEAWSAC